MDGIQPGVRGGVKVFAASSPDFFLGRADVEHLVFPGIDEPEDFIDVLRELPEALPAFPQLFLRPTPAISPNTKPSPPTSVSCPSRPFLGPFLRVVMPQCPFVGPLRHACKRGNPDSIASLAMGLLSAIGQQFGRPHGLTSLAVECARD